MEFEFDWPSIFRDDRKVNDNDDNNNHDGTCTISSPCEPNGSGELRSRSFETSNV